MFNIAHRLAVEQLQTLDLESRLIVLHPNYTRQRLLFDHFLQDGDAVYVRFDGHALTADALQAQLMKAVQEQTGDDNLAAVRTLVLDELDRGEPDAVDDVLPDIMARVVDGRVVVSSRLLLRCVMQNNSLRRQTRFIPVDDDLMLWDYARHETTHQHLVEVRSLGAGRVLLNGECIDDWDGLLPRSLFFYLIDRGMTTRNDIFKVFWPNLTVREATNVFHVTKRKISEVLGVDLTSYWSGFYHISANINLSYDVVQFAGMAQRGGIQGNSASSDSLRRAIELYRDDFLTSLGTDWAQQRRNELRQLYGEALSSLAKILEGEENHKAALGLYLRAMRANRHREDVAYSAMLLYRQLGMEADALTVYERLEAELAQNLNVAPARHLQELAEAIRRDIPRV